MKRESKKTVSKTNNRKVNFKFNPKDFNIFQAKWKSPKDNKENEFNINLDPRKFKTIEIEDNH